MLFNIWQHVAKQNDILYLVMKQMQFKYINSRVLDLSNLSNHFAYLFSNMLYNFWQHVAKQNYNQYLLYSIKQIQFKYTYSKIIDLQIFLNIFI